MIPIPLVQNAMRTKHLFYRTLAFLGLFLTRLDGAWLDKTSGAPWLEHHSARSMGTETAHLSIVEDPLGRLYVGSFGLVVNDGTAWKTYRVGNGAGVRVVRFGADGRLWVGAINEIGYFTEPTIGNFEYHSLLAHLPETERQVGQIWGVGLVGPHVYFLSREKIYRWNGTTFQIWSFPGSSRLFPLQLGEEFWFQHLETGLYRLTESGPKLEIDRAHLPAAAILGLQRLPQGLLLATSDGFSLPGNPPQKIFPDEVNRFVIENRLTCYAFLPDGNHVVGTVNGGLMILSAGGQRLRIIDSRDHPALGLIQAICVRKDGQIWCATQDGLFRLDSSGSVTLFHARNGLGGGVQELDADTERLYVSSTAGTFRLLPAGEHPAAFQREPKLKETYFSLRLHADGLLLGRHGGIDYYDGTSARPLYELLAKGVYRIIPSSHPSGTFVLSESDALARLRPMADGSFERSPIARIPDFVRWLAEDSRGRVWAGTLSQGAFVVDTAAPGATAVIDPVSGQPLKGYVCFSRGDTDLLLFSAQRVLRAEVDGANLELLLNLPAVEPTTALAVPGARSALVAFKRTGAASASSWGQGLGRLTIAANGRAEWQELDTPALESIGLVQSLKFTEENGRRILWAGGTEGLLRFDYDAIPLMRAPPAPCIRLDTASSGAPVKVERLEFPFEGHRLNFRIFLGDPTRQHDWRVQTRLGQNGTAWSAITDRRTFEFSNLSEGHYRFAVRTVNAAGLASAPAVLTFRILPPWYRSGGAYAAYAVILVAGVVLTIRFRERRARARQEELEKLVQVRTAELVKANAAKDEFLAGVSHEIRNPMSGVIGISESLSISGLDPESQRKFGLLRACADHLASLLEDLLDLSKMQAGVIELDIRPFDLHELVGAVAAMAAADSEKYRIPVETAISPGVPRHLLGDPRRIRQILLNFVSNALKFSGRGKVEVTVWCQSAGQPDRTEVIFAVTDEGPGISPEEQQKLFKRFERGAAARGRRVPGTGLGLALCKGYAEKMGGRIWLESEPGHGSCFYFSAPFASAPEPAGAPAAARITSGGSARLALVVDDMDYNRVVLTDLLAQLGYTAQATGDGAEALALAGRHDFELVFLDCDLPGMSGLEVTRGLRALPGRSARATVFATTAFNTPAKQQECLDAGMNAFLGKPVTLERLRKALAAAGTGVTAPPPVAPPAAPPPPADHLANLRLLAAKKQVRFADELALYLSEMQVELEQLDAAARSRSVADAAHYAHRLCGRLSFIYERELERTMRRLEEAAAKGNWPEVARLQAELPALIADLRLRLASSAPAAPPA